jgi:hypothetical protein
MLRQQCKVKGLACKTKPFPRSTKTSAYGWAMGSTRLRGVSLQVDYKFTKEIKEL